MNDQAATPVWAGFWARLWAFVLDGILLGLIGFGVGQLMFDQLARMGSEARLIGLAAALLYFGVLSSGIGGGRTVFQRLFGLKVTRLDGRPIGLVRSLLRAAALYIPMLLNGAVFDIPDERLQIPLGIVIAILVFGVGAAQIYLMLFNRPSRQLVHDLLQRTVVVRKAAKEIPPTGSGRHAVVALLITLATPALVVGGLFYVLHSNFFDRMQPLSDAQEAVAALPEVMQVGVNDNTTTVSTGGGATETTRTLIINARLSTRPTNVDNEVRRIGEVAWKAYKLAPGQTMRIVLTYGFDIGIASQWRNEVRDYAGPSIPAPPPAQAPASASSAAPASGAKS